MSDTKYKKIKTPFKEIRLEPDYHAEDGKVTWKEKFITLCVVKIDQLTIDMITKVAKENGFTQAYILERGFILDALMNESLRRESPGEVSDGYHTFNELYTHRGYLFAMICADHQDIAWKSKKHHDGTMYDGMFLAGLNTPYGQATYHMDIEPFWDALKVTELPAAPEWDGHTPKMALERIAAMAVDKFIPYSGGIVED